MSRGVLFQSAVLLAAAINFSYAEAGCVPPAEDQSLLDVFECFQSVLDAQQKQIKALGVANRAQQKLIKAQGEEIEALKLRLDLSSGLVAYYPFDGYANDASGHGHHGVVKGATLTGDRFGNPNNAYSFDGEDDCILAKDADSLDIQNDISLVAWVKTDGSHKNVGMIVAKHFTSNARAYTLFDSGGVWEPSFFFSRHD